MTSISYQKAGGQAEQAINGVRTVKSLNGESFEIKNYNIHVIEAMKIALRYSLASGFAMGSIFLFNFLDCAVSFYYGSILVEDGDNNEFYDRPYNIGDVMVIFMAI